VISQKSIQEVFDNVQVEDLIQDYITLKRRGVNMIGLCPFHDEKTPSFTVSPNKNIYKCFGCGKGGGPVQFIMEHDQLSFPEAIRALAAKYNITLEEDNKKDDKEYAAQKKQEESLYIINDFALKHYTDNLFNTQDGKLIGLSYFKERGFLEATIEKFQLGFALDDSKGFVTKALANLFKEAYLKEVGLMSQRGYDFFRNRVMFPIHSVSGKVIAFAGRTLSTQKSQPKYINSPETPIYNKRKILYGMHLAKAAIRKKENCLIVEGYTDVISLVQNGIENVVASSGTALTSAQVRLVKRFTDNVTFLYDGDTAGVKAAMRGLDLVLENGMNVSLVLLPDGEDPDSFVKANGNAGFEAYIKEEAKDFIFFKMDLLLKESESDPIKKAKVIQDIIGSIAKVREPIKRSLYVQQCSRALNVSEPILVKEVNKTIRSEIKQKQVQEERAQRRQSRERDNQPPPFQGPSPGQATGTPPLGPPPSEAGFPGEEYPDAAYDEWQDYPEDQVKHVQPSFVNTSTHEFQERDLARIVIEHGDKNVHQLWIEKTKEWKNEVEDDITIAELIYTEIFDVMGYFENEKYKQVITEGFNFVESTERNGSISDYFINHQEPSIASLAIDVLSEPYEFADWIGKGVYLNQKMPAWNFREDSRMSILMFKLKKMTQVLKILSERISNEENSQTRETLLKAFMEMQGQKSLLSKELGVVIPPK
jgi:DNA primase